jgi:hypothetical protein
MTEPPKMRSRKELHAEIARLEKKLEKEKEEIRDNFRFSNIVIGILPEFMRVQLPEGKNLTLGNYLSSLAGNFISGNKEGNNK